MQRLVAAACSDSDGGDKGGACAVPHRRRRRIAAGQPLKRFARQEGALGRPHRGRLSRFTGLGRPGREPGLEERPGAQAAGGSGAL